ncbi:hypothetical protein [Donghicola mangrovi]|uniref:hypothetical protein n=1 Tax=Donghicola mangrovi TaxID=2729614 RepID=UPI001D15016F|nr:hypothetical protein [Donghicola mangrovi]
MIRKTLTILCTAGLLASTCATATLAGPVERACRQSDRPQASASLCGCIGRVADQTLSNSDQRQAAQFFKDSDKAQEIKMSDNRSHKAFWERYKRFGQTAEAYCS